MVTVGFIPRIGASKLEMRRIATLETGIAATSFNRRSATAMMFRATSP
jgi:hypothetical protein